MATKFQQIGLFGENLIIKKCSCPKCKQQKTLKRLPANFKCADIICDFCGYLAQVKTTQVNDINKVPKQILGAAWQPQKERMDAGIYFPLFLVLVKKDKINEHSVHYLSADLQEPEIFKPRKALSQDAKRAGWQGFMYELESITPRIVKIA